VLFGGLLGRRSHVVERVWTSSGGETGVYGGVLVRNVHGNLYLDMELATESEVAATEGSTATGAPLSKSETGEVRFRVCPHTTRLETETGGRSVGGECN